MNAAAEAVELAIKAAKIKAAVSRALTYWEVWTVAASVLYFAAHFASWAHLSFRVVGR